MIKYLAQYTLAFLVLGQSYAFAYPDISCTPKEEIADGGYSVSVTREGSDYHYYFSQNSISGPRPIADFSVMLQTGQNSVNNKEIEVFAKTRNGLQDKFSFVSTDGENFLIRTTDGKAPDLNCKLNEAIFNRYLRRSAPSDCRN